MPVLRGQQTSTAASKDALKAAATQVVHNAFKALANKDLDGFMALWAAGAHERERRKGIAAALFEKAQRIEVGKVESRK